MEVSCAVIHASCYFLNNFQHFTRLFWIPREEKLKGVRKQQDSHFISTLLQLCFFCAKSKVCFPNKKIRAFLILLFCYNHLKFFFWTHQETNKSFWSCSFDPNALFCFLKTLFNHWATKNNLCQNVMNSNYNFRFFLNPTHLVIIVIGKVDDFRDLPTKASLRN